MALICLDGTKYPVLRTENLLKAPVGTFFTCKDEEGDYIYFTTGADRCWNYRPAIHLCGSHGNGRYDWLDFLPRLLDGTNLLP